MINDQINSRKRMAEKEGRQAGRPLLLNKNKNNRLVIPCINLRIQCFFLLL